MHFKPDWSFLEKVSMGACSSKKVIDILNANGHNVIELERYSTKNKLWSTKIKRLRLPDLMCLKCGARIESRAKSTLEIKMSDNEKANDRRWDAGLRDEDLIAFIQCTKENDVWKPADELNLFTTKSLRDTVEYSKIGKPKSASEGAERDRSWKTIVPNKNGRILSVEECDSKLRIKVEHEDGKRYTYSKKDSLQFVSYVKSGDTYTAKTSIIAGIPKCKATCECKGTYDFIKDIENEDKSVRIAGVKALGYFPRKSEYIEKLKNIVAKENDIRVKLEAYSSLIRQGEDVWSEVHEYAMSLTEAEYKFEYVLIMSELNDFDRAQEVLVSLAMEKTNDLELRAAAVWGMRIDEVYIKKLMDIIVISEDTVVSHALSNIILNFKQELTKPIIEMVYDYKTAVYVIKVLKETTNVNYEVIKDLYLSSDSFSESWIYLLIGFLGKNKFEPYWEEIAAKSATNYQFISNLWEYTDNYFGNDIEREIEFLKKQSL